MFYNMARRWPKKYHIQEKDVVEDILQKLLDKFGKQSPLTTTRGNVLEFYGIKINYRQQGKVKFTIYDGIKKILEELPPDMQGTAKTPTKSNLFNTYPDSRNSEVWSSIKFCSVQEMILILPLHFMHLWLQKFINSNAIHEGHEKWTLAIELEVHPDMKSHTVIYDHRKRSYIHSLMQGKIKYKKLNKGRIGSGPWRNVTSTMDNVFLAAQGLHIPTTTIYQEKKLHTGRKWTDIQHKENKTPKPMVFLHSLTKLR